MQRIRISAARTIRRPGNSPAISPTSAAPTDRGQAALVFRLDRFLRGGDHYSFNQQGFAAVRFTEYREDFNHQHQNVRNENGIEYGDLPKFVDFDYVAHVARLNAATLASLASAPRPPATSVADQELENDTTLTWERFAAAAHPTKWSGATPPARNGNTPRRLEMLPAQP